MSKKVQLLDEKTINKIAAGEVIERPASIVKELVENSIDAKATSIIIEILEGGKKYIRVTDNGTGIEKEDLEIAVLRHSTSKIKQVEDLEKLNTLGFRGEALASIASVSQMQIISKTKEGISGRQIKIYGGEIVDINDVGCPTGTTVIVKNIFFNTPVRRKFLKTDNTESSYISDIIYKLALGNPNISFKYIKDNKLILKTPGNNDMLSVIYSLFGKDFTNSLFKIGYSGEDIKINGYISKPSFSRGNRNHQYFYINGRYIKSELISKIVEDEYKTLLPINRFPIAFIDIKMNPEMFDANVHPTKIEIRFKDEDKIRQQIGIAIRNVLDTNNLIPEVEIEDRNNEINEEQKKISDYIDLNGLDIKGKKITTENASDNNSYLGNNFSNKITEKEPLENLIAKEKDDLHYSDKINIEDEHIDSKNYRNESKIPDIKIIGILFETYILAQSYENDEFYIIDQHAAHERIMYEKYKKQFNNESVLTQELLISEPVSLSHSETQIVKENIELFKKLGFIIEDFGINSIIIRSVPMLFGKPDSKKLFLDILDNLQNEIKSSYELRIEKIMKMACTNAIKAGDSISKLEIDSLLKDLRNADNPYTCPHGRPIIIKMTKYEIEKKFKRVQ